MNKYQEALKSYCNGCDYEEFEGQPLKSVLEEK